jgi:ketosteroid isomerase-like protein
MRLAIWLSIPLSLLMPAAVARDAAQDEREILRVEAALCRAFEAGDAAALRRYLHATFTLTDSRGVVSDLEQNLGEVERREPRYQVFRNHSQKVRLYGDAAITTGITTVKGLAGGRPFAADFQFTDTWVYRDGSWKMAASHASRLEAPTPE